MPNKDSLRGKGRLHLQLTTSLCAAILGFSALATTGLSPTTAVAQDASADTYDGGKARVNRSANLRSLTETIAAASCRLDAGIDAANAIQDLQSARDNFHAILTGLEMGDNALGMPGAETRARTLTAIQKTAEMWQPVETAATSLLNGGSSADAATINAATPALFEQTVALAADVAGQYTDPQELLQSDATVLNYATRQRALAYRMSLAICQLATGTGDDAAADRLAETADLFERTLLALRDGFPAAGIAPPPNEAIADSLNQTFELWQANSGLIDAALSGQTPTADDVVTAAALSEKLSVSMNNAITLYLIATPGQDGVYRVPLEAYARGELQSWLENAALIDAIKAQNAQHDGLTEDAIIALDQQWRAEAGAGGGALISDTLGKPMSVWLNEQQAATAGFVTEVFVMDNKGLNVAQSAQTSDYWQGDEAKWQQTYLVGPETLHISEVEFDDSTGFYQSQASMAITDPATGAVIGAVTFGINVQNLM